MRPLVLAIATAVIVLPIALDATAAGKATAVFAGGCYWTMEADMQRIPGVLNVVAGFSPFEPGVAVDPKKPRAYETVKVTYDPGKISYRALAARYLRLTDPTDPGGAFCDRGLNYAPVIFAASPEERAAAQAVLAEARPLLKKPIVTKVLAPTGFKAAPPDQQDWARKNYDRYHAYDMACGKKPAIKRIWGG